MTKNIDLTIFQYGWERCAPLHPTVRQEKPLSVHFIFSGKGYLSSNDSSGTTHLHRLEACQAYLSGAGQHLRYADEHRPGSTPGWNLTGSRPWNFWKWPA